MKQTRKALGIAGEELVDDWMRSLGWVVYKKNIRWKHGELDRVYRLNKTLCLTEIKTRKLMSDLHDDVKSCFRTKQLYNLISQSEYYLSLGWKVQIRVIIVVPQKIPFLRDYKTKFFYFENSTIISSRIDNFF